MSVDSSYESEKVLGCDSKVRSVKRSEELGTNMTVIEAEENVDGITVLSMSN